MGNVNTPGRFSDLRCPDGSGVLAVNLAGLNGAGLVMEQAAAVTWVCRLGKAASVHLTQRFPTVNACKTRKFKFKANPSKVPGGGSVPLGGAEQRRAFGEEGWRLSEPKASLASPPDGRVAEGTRVAGANLGSRFLWRLSFGETKESLPAGQRRNTAHQQLPRISNTRAAGTRIAP